jgi:hypothetical protein
MPAFIGRVFSTDNMSYLLRNPLHFCENHSGHIFGEFVVKNPPCTILTLDDDFNICHFGFLYASASLPLLSYHVCQL